MIKEMYFEGGWSAAAGPQGILIFSNAVVAWGCIFLTTLPGLSPTIIHAELQKTGGEK